MSKTLHFRAVSISRNKERPDNAVAACAYRSGRKLHDQSKEIDHDYRNKGGVVQAEIFAPQASPQWMKENDWERFGNEIENIENGHKRKASALLAKDFQVAAPRELSREQNWKLARNFAKKVNDTHKLAVAAAFHEEKASDGGLNPHYHFMIPMRQVNKDGFSKTKYRKFDRSQKEMMQLRRDYYQCVNEALKEAGFEIQYSPEKQSAEPQYHKGKDATALECEGVNTKVAKFNKRVQEDNLMSHFSKPSKKPQELFSPSFDADYQKKDWNQQLIEWQLLRGSSMAARDAHHKTQSEVATPPVNRSQKAVERAREGARLGAKQSYVSRVQESRGWER